MTTKNYDYILFDLDGTLTDSKPGIIKCIRHALDAKGIECHDSILDKMIGPPFRVSMTEYLGLEMDTVEQLIALYRGRYAVDGWNDLAIYDGVEEALARLKSSGKKLAVATSKPIKFTSMIMQEFGFDKYFDYVGGASTDASKESKADVIQGVLDNFAISDTSNVLMVGDRLFDIVGAHTLNIDCVGVTWGYGSKEEFEQYKAEYIVSTPDELLDLIF